MPERTIFNNEVPFPMVDPYRPVRRARIPVPGLNRFPGRANVLGRHYYGLDTDEGAVTLADVAPGKVTAVNAEAIKIVNQGNDDEVIGFAGFADLPYSGSGFAPPYNPQVNVPDDSRDTAGGGIDWGAIINAGIHSAPAIIQAAEGGGAPYNYYSQAVGVNQSSQLVPSGYYRNASGQLVSLSSANQVAGGLGVGVAQIGNSLTNFVTQNPLLVLGLGAAVLLLFMKPPSRR